METFIRIKALTDKNKFEGGRGGRLSERESTYYMEDDKSKLLR